MKDAAMTFYFEIHGVDFPLEAFIDEMHLAPTHSAKKGDRIKRTTPERYYPVTYYTYALDFDYVDEPLKVIHELLDELTPRLEIIKRYQKQYDLTCKLVGVMYYKDFQTPGLTLDKYAMEFALAINAIYDFDIYTGVLPPGLISD